MSLEYGLFYDFERFVTPKLNRRQASSKSKKGEYPYIALPLGQFEEQVRTVQGMVKGQACTCPGGEHDYEVNCRWGRKVFVDVGCGIGTKLLAVHQLTSFHTVGIECYSPYVEVAKKLVPGAKIIEKDALKVNYAPFDVIYFYCPLSDQEKQRQLEARIIETMKPGAFVMANLKQSSECEVWEAPPMRKVWRNVIYQKVP